MDEFYTSVTEAAQQLKLNQSARGKVEEWWRSHNLEIPVLLRPHQPTAYAILARQLATFRYEDAAFVLMAERAGLKPLWLPYSSDLLVSKSRLKMSYVQPHFVTRIGNKGRAVIERRELAKISGNEGRRLSEIYCQDGKTLVDHHLEQLLMMYPSATVEDISPVWNVLAKPEHYYPFLLSLLIAHGVLFDDFHEDKDPQLSWFTKRIFEPAFCQIRDLFGIKPIIVPLPNWPELDYYPSPELRRVISWRCHAFALREYATSPVLCST